MKLDREWDEIATACGRRREQIQIFSMEGVVESLLNGFFRMRRFTKTLTIRMYFQQGRLEKEI
jgi:hypothetical protein